MSCYLLSTDAIRPSFRHNYSWWTSIDETVLPQRSQCWTFFAPALSVLIWDPSSPSFFLQFWLRAHLGWRVSCSTRNPTRRHQAEFVCLQSQRSSRYIQSVFEQSLFGIAEHGGKNTVEMPLTESTDPTSKVRAKQAASIRRSPIALLSSSSVFSSLSQITSLTA